MCVWVGGWVGVARNSSRVVGCTMTLMCTTCVTAVSVGGCVGVWVCGCVGVYGEKLEQSSRLHIVTDDQAFQHHGAILSEIYISYDRSIHLHTYL